MSRHVGFSIETAEAGDALLVRPQGELDLATTPELERLVLGRLEEGRPVVLDLRGLEFMDSSGVRVLVAANARSEAAGGPLRIVRPEPGSPVERILAVSGIDRALPFVDDVDEPA
jgi:anti-sigma B factor antagonist